MNIYDLFSTRESIHSFDPAKPVPEEILMNILNAGRLAPSASNRQPWQFILASSVRMRKKIHPCYEQRWFESAPHILIVKGKREEAWTRPTDGYNTLETDLAVAMDHMILAAEYEGVGTCWIAAFSPEVLRYALSLEKEEDVFAITPLGYPKAGFHRTGKLVRKELEEVIRII